MKLRANIAIPFVLLLIPTALVGWIGLSQIGNLEKKLNSNFHQWAGLALKQAKQACLEEYNAFLKAPKALISNRTKKTLLLQKRSGYRFLFRDKFSSFLLLSEAIKPFSFFPRTKLHSMEGIFGWLMAIGKRNKNTKNLTFIKLMGIKLLLDAKVLPKEKASLWLKELSPKNLTLRAARVCILLSLGKADRRLLSEAFELTDEMISNPTRLATKKEQEILGTLYLSVIANISRSLDESTAPLFNQYILESFGETFSKEAINALGENSFGLLPIPFQRLIFENSESLLLSLSGVDSLDWLEKKRSAIYKIWDDLQRNAFIFSEVILPLSEQIKLLEPGQGISYPVLEKSGDVVSVWCVNTKDQKKVYFALLFNPEHLLWEKLKTLERELGKGGIPFAITLSGTNYLIAQRPGDEIWNDPTKPFTKSITIPLTPFFGLNLIVTPINPNQSLKAQRKNLLLKSLLLIGLSLIAVVGGVMLYKTTKKERDLIALKSGFMERVSHELKTPLSLIRLYSETLESGKVVDGEKIKGFAGIIHKEALRLSSMIENVLNFSRLERKEAGRPGLHKIKAPTIEVIESFLPQLEMEGFTVKVNPIEDVLLFVNLEKYKGTIVNLISNARKFSKLDRYIEIETRVDGDFFWFSIKDHGIGIKEEERNSIFKEFYRGSNSFSTRGVGLGLSLAKDFVRSAGGEIWTEPFSPMGTIVTFTIPLYKNGNDKS